MPPVETETGIGVEGIVESRDHPALCGQAVSEAGNVDRGFDSDLICCSSDRATSNYNTVQRAK